MPNVVLVGAQWGDEGKGKIIDLLSEQADTIVRYQGGSNAGHTVVVNGNTFILHLVPSGILHPGKVCVIGNGVVVDPQTLFDEIDQLEHRGVRTRGRIWVSSRAHLIFPYHKQMDKLRELERGAGKIGTTGRGIGPCYADKTNRIGLRVGDLHDRKRFTETVLANCRDKNIYFRSVHTDHTLDERDVLKRYWAYRRRLLPMTTDTTRLLEQAMRRNKTILLEGAQGTLLDLDHGTYPYVTSSSASAGGACTGTGIGPSRIHAVIGVAKAYTTRVGEGPLPTELGGRMAAEFQRLAKEFGATTGRPRRCGWFDAVVVRYSARINGIDRMAITKLDVLDRYPAIRICVGYRLGRRRVDAIPASLDELGRCQPIYEEHRGWMTSTHRCRRWSDLPRAAQSYLRRLEKLTGVPISLVSVGSQRHETIFIRRDLLNPARHRARR